MIIYSREYFLEKILECSETELSKAKIQARFCPKTSIPKKGGTRTIVDVGENEELRKLQKNLRKNFFSKLPVSPAAKGFRKGMSYLDFLEEHVGSNFFLRMDISNFFDSISKDSFLKNLEPYVESGQIKNEILALCTIVGKVPQGFLTSPDISNLIFRRIDQRIRKYCRAYYKERKREIFYTRYADDLLFSSDHFDFKKNRNFKAMIDGILSENKFSCNESKTIYQSGEISLSGYVVQKDVHLSRKKLRNINEVIYRFDGRSRGAGDNAPFFVKPNPDLGAVLREINSRKLIKSDGSSLMFGSVQMLYQYLAGCRSYLIQIARTEHGDTGYGKQISGKIRKLEAIMDCITEQQEKKEGKQDGGRQD